MEDIRLYDLSEAEESDVERSGGDATYGEMSFEMVDWFLEHAANLDPRDDTICDLGSGGCRVLLYAALRSGCRAVGVELSPTRHQSAVTLVGLAEPFLRPGQVVLQLGDIADVGGPQRSSTVVLFPNRLFTDEFSERVLRALERPRCLLALRPVTPWSVPWAAAPPPADVPSARLPTSWGREEPVWLYRAR